MLASNAQSPQVLSQLVCKLGVVGHVGLIALGGREEVEVGGSEVQGHPWLNKTSISKNVNLEWICSAITMVLRLTSVPTVGPGILVEWIVCQTLHSVSDEFLLRPTS